MVIHHVNYVVYTQIGTYKSWLWPHACPFTHALVNWNILESAKEEAHQMVDYFCHGGCH